MMKILAIDTVTENCSAALWLDGEILSRSVIDPTGHSRLILDQVHELLAEAQLSLQALDGLATDVGPGSFTGLRIGLGVAQGLAYGADLPVAPINSLAALAMQAEPGDSVLAAIDARMGEVYWGQFARADQGLVALGDLRLSTPDVVGEMLGDVVPLSGIGSGWDTYSKILHASTGIRRWEIERFPNALEVATLATRLPEKEWVNAAALTPVYLRNEVAKVSQKSPLQR